MKVLDWIFPARRDAQVLELAERISQDQHDRIWQQLAVRAGLLGSVSEARGYIRCRALQILRAGLQGVVDPNAKLTPELQDRVVERAVELIVGQFAGPMVNAAPALVSSRRAA